MPEQLQQLLMDAAPAPHRDLDPDLMWARGRRRRRARRAALAGGGLVAAALVTLALQLPRSANVDFAAPTPADSTERSPSEFAGSLPRISAVEAVLPEGGVVAERGVPSARVRAIVRDNGLCLQILPPGPPGFGADPWETAGAQGCGGVDTLPHWLADQGVMYSYTARSEDQWEAFAGIVADGYTTATSEDGRRWDIVDNLLVIAVHPDDPGEFAAGMPRDVELAGPAGRRTIHVSDPMPGFSYEWRQLPGAPEALSPPAEDRSWLQRSCASPVLSRELAEFLEEWTEGPESLYSNVCVLVGRPGPAPQFDTSSFGDEQPLHPGKVPADAELPRSGFWRLADGYPFVHLGSGVFLSWQLTGQSLVVCAQSTCGSSDMIGDDPGLRAVGSGGPYLAFDVFVPDGTSVVAAEVAGRRVWQRPVARVALVSVGFAGRSPEEAIDHHENGIPYQLTYMDADGNVLGEDSGRWD